jgi:hypothetical protein
VPRGVWAEDLTGPSAGSCAIVFVAWGDVHVAAVQRCIDESRLPDYPVFLMTDPGTDTTTLTSDISIVRRSFRLPGKHRKMEALAAVPEGLGTVLFLDADTRVIDDISLGYEKARQHGIAMAPAPHYSLADFRSFREVMRREGVEPRGEMIYNSGVIFFASDRREVREVFTTAIALSQEDVDATWSDQPYVTLAMEMLGFNPYTLSPSFNHRAFGELISGSIRVWHSPSPVPPDAADLEPGHLHRYERGRFTRAMKVPL